MCVFLLNPCIALHTRTNVQIKSFHSQDYIVPAMRFLLLFLSLRS